MNQGDLFSRIEPPAQRHSRTSVAAAEQIEPRSETLRRAVLDYLRQCGESGATDEEGITATGMSANTYRPRRIELVSLGLVKDSGATRATNSKRQAVIWIAVVRSNEGETHAMGV